ncbi:hypothetical protein WAI453_001381 [Rhynchosporium graminicola]|uniref:Secreted protein n=1 Tax=Rhynchosporium graminicola TaxID=2792576 RepID=A0A1E1LEH7_9HELO|nr:uncharacterized protein RCO7_08131 [Rhynchosporium commune]
MRTSIVFTLSFLLPFTVADGPICTQRTLQCTSASECTALFNAYYGTCTSTEEPNSCFYHKAHAKHGLPYAVECTCCKMG